MYKHLEDIADKLAGQKKLFDEAYSDNGCNMKKAEKLLNEFLVEDFPINWKTSKKRVIKEDAKESSFECYNVGFDLKLPKENLDTPGDISYDSIINIGPNVESYFICCNKQCSVVMIIIANCLFDYCIKHGLIIKDKKKYIKNPAIKEDYMSGDLLFQICEVNGFGAKYF